MTPDICYAYTQALLRTVAPDAAELMLGHDLHPSSPALAAACIQAVIDAELKVVFVGALPTPRVAFYASTRKAPAIIITFRLIAMASSFIRQTVRSARPMNRPC